MNKPHKQAEVIKAWADGAQVELQNKSGTWSIVERPYFDAKYRAYRVYDPLREYKDAYARGEKIEVFYQGTWQSVKAIAARGPFYERPDIVFCLEVITNNPLRIVPKPDYIEHGTVYLRDPNGGLAVHVDITISGETGKPKSVELVK